MKSFVKFGLGTGLLVSAWNLSCFTIVSWIDKTLLLGIPVARIRAYSGLFGIVLLIIGVYVGIREAKKKNENQITFGEALRTGIFISLISAAIAGLFAFIYCTIINPGYADYMVRDAESTLMASKKTSKEISQELIQVRNRFSTTTQVLQALIAQSVMGSIGSLIISLFIRSKK